MKKLIIQRVAFLLISTLLVLALAGMGGKPSSGSMVFPADAGQAYASLADAMQSDGFSTHCLPTWIPEDFSITNIDEKSNSKMYRISAEYVSMLGRGNLQIRALITSNNVLHFMEKDPGGYTLLHNDLEIYVYTNSGDYRASWFADDIIFTVSFYPGSPDSITEQEFLMIVESIPK